MLQINSESADLCGFTKGPGFEDPPRARTDTLIMVPLGYCPGFPFCHPTSEVSAEEVQYRSVSC